MWCLLSVNSLTIAVEIWPAELKAGRLALAVNPLRNNITSVVQTTEIWSGQHHNSYLLPLQVLFSSGFQTDTEMEIFPVLI